MQKPRVWFYKNIQNGRQHVQILNLSYVRKQDPLFFIVGLSIDPQRKNKLGLNKIDKSPNGSWLDILFNSVFSLSLQEHPHSITNKEF